MPAARSPGKECRDWPVRAACILLAAAGLTAVLRPVVLPGRQERSYRSLRAAVAARDSRAAEIGAEHVHRFPDDLAGIVLAADAAAQRGDHAAAISFLERLPNDGGQWEARREEGIGDRLAAIGRFSEAERRLTRALAIHPYDIGASSRLAHLLQVSGRVWESAPHFFNQIQNGKCRGDELLGISATDRFFRSDERMERQGLAADPPDPLILLAEARRALMDNRGEEAEHLLRTVIAARPDLGEAQGRLGRIIVDRGDHTEFMLWRGGLADEARAHPEVAFAEGLQARRLGQIENAVYCFLYALQLSPNHLGANLQVAGCLEQLGRVEAAKLFSDRAALLAKLEANLNVLRSELSEERLLDTISMLGAMGRYWEAAGWAQVSTHVDIPQERMRVALDRWMPLAVRGEPANATALLPAVQGNLKPQDFPTPWWPPGENPRSPALGADEQTTAATVDWDFQDEASAAGIEFQYFEGTDEAHRLEHIFNVMGGGLAAVDYDMDLWPDLYLAQANDWRDPVPQLDYVDPLYRNLGGRRFVEVTAAAGVGDASFSHGVTAGDYDQDGFPDLYIGNKGGNRLYRNLGDGTFEDATEFAGVAGDDEDWSTSSVFADLTGDGCPDLYVLNYTLVTPTAEKECTQGDRPVACTPDVLPACLDRCFVSNGDGTFRDMSAAVGIQMPNSRGLGVIAWPFGTDHRLGLFVANDTTANALFINEGTDESGTPRFSECAALRGVAYDVDGNAQASMGVAAGDVTGDGRIDLFVTNFFADSNTQYAQDAAGFFQDVTRTLQLRDAGFWMLGFGCQYADLDGDGWLDIIATNGHVDQKSSRGDPDHMPPQVFRNLRGQKFVEAAAADLGPFFQSVYLGRGLATLDWNGDGATDFAISHLHAPFALVSNRSRPRDDLETLTVRLIGRSGCREPTGAIVTVTANGQPITRLQTAGDGFLVTNERRHTFAAPQDGAISITVQWPDASLQQWDGLAPGQDVILEEGRTEPLPLRPLPRF